MTPTERLQRDFLIAAFRALDRLPVVSHGEPQPSGNSLPGSRNQTAAHPTATDAAGVAEPPPVSAPGGSPTTTLAPSSGAPAGGTSSAEADARVARPNIIAACRGAAEPEVQP